VHRCSVLVVDDDPDVREMLRVALKSEGYEVATAANGVDALHHLRSTPETCVVLLDLLMPLMDGGAFRAALARDRSLSWIPVVVMSGGFEVARQARELGARSFVPKPVDLDRLRRVLGSIRCPLADFASR
jgi:CheY-like chemotaxis protein